MEKNVGMIGLRLIRKQRKYSQLKVAFDLNISREALSHYETGKRSPDIQMLRQLSDYFNISIDYLINGTEFSSNKLNWFFAISHTSTNILLPGSATRK